MRPALVAAALLAACSGRPPAGSVFETEWRAARAHFERANERLHEALLTFRADDLEELLDAEDRLDDDVRNDLRALAGEGARRAEAAAALEPDRPQGHLYLALNLGLLALAKSRAAALLEGLPGRIRRAYERALELDPGVAWGGAHRFRGRYLARAPWPIRDEAAAEEALRRADGVARVRQNALFLGDLLHRRGRRDEAVALWREAVARAPHPATASIDTAVAELARRRLALVR